MKNCLKIEHSGFWGGLRPGKSQGFILMATLWILAGLAMVASYFSYQTEKSVDDAIKVKQRIQQNLTRQSNIETVLYMLSTRDRNRMGLMIEPGDVQLDDTGAPLWTDKGDEIRLDGRRYQIQGDERFSIQDESGFISVNKPYYLGFSKLLESLELEFSHRQIFQARVYDYLSRSELASLNGTTSRDYEDAGLPLPTKRFMQTSQELRKVYKWQELMSEHQINRLVAATTGVEQQRINFNVITPESLSLLGFDQVSIDKLLEYRRDKAFRSVAEVSQVTGQLITQLDPEEVGFIPSRYHRLKFWVNDYPQAEVLGVYLTPYLSDTGPSAPWRVEYRYLANESYTGIYPVAETTSPLLKSTQSTE